MSVLRDIFDGFMSGVASATGQPHAPHAGRIDRLCRELGWSVDERDGEVVRLHFQDPAVGVRKVSIAGADTEVVVLSTASTAFLPPERVPVQVLWHLLNCNHDNAFGSWEGVVDRDGDAIFLLAYTALAEGLTAGALKYICEKLVTQASAFDQKMRAAGLTMEH